MASARLHLVFLNCHIICQKKKNNMLLLLCQLSYFVFNSLVSLIYTLSTTKISAIKASSRDCSSAIRST